MAQERSTGRRAEAKVSRSDESSTSKATRVKPSARKSVETSSSKAESTSVSPMVANKKNAGKSGSNRGNPIAQQATHTPPSQTTNPDLVKPAPRRRPAGPARARVAANDDAPSIGGLIYALQQRPSKRPFLVALIASCVWFVIGGILSWTVISQHLSAPGTSQSLFSSPAMIVVAATIIIPIALFWFLALLIWRAQELRLMSSAMTEVAVRLAEPDRMAEQQVASLGQTVRRQVAAMNDAIGRALGRAGELEALVHNEVAALERSYSENELRVRGLIEELSTEREALTNNSERMGDTIRGIGAQVARDLAIAGEQVTKALAATTNSLSDSLSTKGEKVTSALSAAGTAIEDKLTDRSTRITEQLVTHGAQTVDMLQKAGQEVNRTLQESTDRTSALVSAKSNTLVQSLSSMNERIGKDIPVLLEKLGGEQLRLSHIIEDAAKNLGALETTLAQRTGNLDATLNDRAQELQMVISNHLQAIDAKMVERTKAIDAAFAQRVQQLDTSVNQQTQTLTKALNERSETLQVTLSKHAETVDKSFMRGVEAFRETTDNIASESIQAVEALASQANVLKDVSEGLLSQVNSLTDRFENKGQSIMQVAHALESSQTRIDTVLETRQSELSGLIEHISSKAQDLDGMMKSYSNQLENSLSDAQIRAKELAETITHESQAKSQDAIAELEKLRKTTEFQAERAVTELRDRFSSVTQEVTDQISTLSTQFSDTTDELRQTATKAASEIDQAHTEIKKKIDVLPETTQQSADAMRKALQDQLKALDSLTTIANQQGRARDVSQSASYVQSPSKPSRRPQISSPPAPAPAPPNQAGSPTQRPQPPSNEVSQKPYVNELDVVAASLSQYPQNRQENLNFGGPVDASGQQWSMGDLLARASEPDEAYMGPSQFREEKRQGGSPAISMPLHSINMDAIARAIDHKTAAQLWRRYQSGERGFFNRNLYTPEGQATFDEIHRRYDVDRNFRETVDRYLVDFERLLREADQRDPGGRLVQNYLTSETGRVYLLLAHASGRLG